MKFDDIPGWFMPVDQALFSWILKHQNATQAPGAIVELGVFKGKSAVVIGNFVRPGEVFTACDLFDDIETSEAADAGERAFFKTQSLTQAEFERNYLAFHKTLPRIVRAPTGEITRHVAPGTARFVHIDAGHTYSLVKEDTASAKKMLRQDGVVVFDDYVKVNTMGTAAAMWEALLNDGLKPICNSNWKLYATWGDPAPYRAAVRAQVAESGWAQCSHDIMIRDEPMVYVSRKG